MCIFNFFFWLGSKANKRIMEILKKEEMGCCSIRKNEHVFFWLFG
jgi:hypothetical protein